MSSIDYDLLIVGGGPGGYVAAIRAKQLGMKVAVIESEHMGGICLNWGCIPTKSLLRSSEIASYIKHAEDYGFTSSELKVDIKKVVDRSRGVAKKLSSGVDYLMQKNSIEVIEGFGSLLGSGIVNVTDKNGVETKKSAENIILATGATAKIIPGFEPDGKIVNTYKDAMIPSSIPQTILIVGSGAIGMEFASFYHDLGSKVTVIEMLDRILPNEDEDISIFAKRRFEEEGINILTNTVLNELKKNKTDVTVKLQKDKFENLEISIDKVILAVGIQANVNNIGLENTSIKLKDGHINTNEWLETEESGVYAIGDVVGPPWLAHKASHEGIICVEKIAGVKGVKPLNKNRIPNCTYCRPQIASIGITEMQAKERSLNIRVGRFNFSGNGKALALGEPKGMVKTIFDNDTGELLGAHLIGAEVTELIQGFVIAMNLETTEHELMECIFPHPTLSEMIHESVLDAHDRAIHS